MALVKKIMSCHPQVTVAMLLIGVVVSMCFGLIDMLKAYHRVQQSCTIRATFSSLAITGNADAEHGTLPLFTGVGSV